MKLQYKLTAISCIKSAASAISPCSSLIFASFLIRRALSISTYIYKWIPKHITFEHKLLYYKPQAGDISQCIYSIPTFPEETLFSVLISSIRVSRSGVSSMYSIAFCTIAVTACIRQSSGTKRTNHILYITYEKIRKCKRLKRHVDKISLDGKVTRQLPILQLHFLQCMGQSA